MKFTTLAVGAGSCHILETDDGQVWLFDCGSGEGNEPAQYLRWKEKGQVDYLFVLNEDDDHLSGLAELIAWGLQPRAIVRNRTINRTEWVRSKGGKSALSENAKAWKNLVESYRDEGPWPSAPNAEVDWIHNPWSRVGGDTNNASLLVRLEIFGEAIILPGDLEQHGWRVMWKEQYARLQQMVQDARFWVAAHHGRENGYVREVLDLAGNEIDGVIVSDKRIMYGTQERRSDRYAAHSRGVTVKRRSHLIPKEEQRQVLTTSKDGAISIEWSYRSRGAGFDPNPQSALAVPWLNMPICTREVWID